LWRLEGLGRSTGVFVFTHEDFLQDLQPREHGCPAVKLLGSMGAWRRWGAPMVEVWLKRRLCMARQVHLAGVAGFGRCLLAHATGGLPSLVAPSGAAQGLRGSHSNDTTRGTCGCPSV
jgi:hypothetical protein